MNKYGIQTEDLYNFDEIDFIIGIITAFMVITRSDKYGKAKSIQFNNQKQAIVIECINTSGWCIPSFIIVKGIYHFFN